MSEVFRRSPKATRRHLINLLIVAGAAGYFWWDFGQTGLTYSKVMAIIFSVWAVFVLVTFLRRFTVAKISDQTIVVQGVLRRATVPVADIKHYRVQAGERTGMFVWNDGGKDRFFAISLRPLEAEQVENLAAAMARLRPDLENLTRERMLEIYQPKAKTKI